MKRSCVWFLFGGLWLGLLAFGQEPGTPAHFRVGPVYTTEFPILDIVVEASAGSTLNSSISASDLILTEEGVRTSAALGLRKFGETSQGVTVLLAVDASGSMRGRPIDAVRKGLGQFVSKARDNDKIGVMSFADDVRWESEWSGSRDETRRKLEGIQPRGRHTVLWDAVDTALDELAKVNGPARRHLVIISDGHDEGSRKSLAQVIARAVSLRIPVDAIGMTRNSPQYLDNLKALSAQSKGSYTTAPDLEALTRLVGTAIDSLLDSPVARFRVEKLKADGNQRRVGVYWKATGQEDEISLALPPGGELPPPSSPSAQPAGRITRKLRPLDYVAIAGGLAALLVLAWLLIRRPRANAPPPQPLPDPQPLRDPQAYPQPLPDPQSLPGPQSLAGPQALPDPPAHSQLIRDAWLPDPGLPSPGLPNPGLPNPGLPGPSLPIRVDLPPVVPEPQRAQIPDIPTAKFAPPPISASPRPRPRTEFAAGFTPPAFLIAKSGPYAGKTFRIDHTDFWVGAAENNHLRLDDETVSGNHAFFRFEAGTLKVFDNHSTNDTWVNRQPVTGTARIVSPGDEIQIGKSVFVVERAQEGTQKNVAQPGPPLALS